MEFLAGLYTLLLVAICLLQALLLHRTGKPAARQDDEALKEWLHQQLEAQARVLEEKQAQQAQQNLAAMAHISDTLQTAVQGMSSTLTAGQNTQQQTMEQRLQGLEASNARKLEEMRKALADGLAAMQAQNAQKLDEIRHTVDEQLQDALQKRVTESFKAVNDQLEQVYKGLGEMQSLAADVGGLKQVLSGVKTRGILGEIQLGAIFRRDPCAGAVRHQRGHHPRQHPAGGVRHPYARCGRQQRLAAHRLQISRRYLRTPAGRAGFRRCTGSGKRPPRAGAGAAQRGKGYPGKICGAALYHGLRHPVSAL